MNRSVECMRRSRRTGSLMYGTAMRLKGWEGTQTRDAPIVWEATAATYVPMALAGRTVLKDKRGVCGITADGMAMRNMLLKNIMGASTYQYHTDQTVRTLRETAKGKTPFSIREPEKLRSFAQRLGVDIDGSNEEVTIRLCDAVVEDFGRSYEEPSIIIDALAPNDRKEVWKKLNIFPGGIYSEMMIATSACLTNVDGYYVSLALKAMRLGVAMAYQSQLVNETMQDIMFGIPRPHEMRVDLGVLDPDMMLTSCPMAMSHSWGSPLFNRHEIMNGRTRP